MFSVEFSGRHYATLCADICTDANLMDTDLLDRFCSAGGNIVVEYISPPSRLTIAAAAQDGCLSSLFYDKAATMDIDIHVRHGTALKVGNARWPANSQNVPEPLLGGPLLECLALDNAEIVAAAADQSARVVEDQYLWD